MDRMRMETEDLIIGKHEGERIHSIEAISVKTSETFAYIASYYDSNPAVKRLMRV